MIVTRFAPSPSGHLHLGHAHAALVAWDRARAGGGRFLLRMEDIDVGRCRPEFEQDIIDDLAWLGEGLEDFTWQQPVRRQSDCLEDYAAALARLDGMGLLYPCFCTRAHIRAEIEGAASAPHGSPHGPDGPLYPGTCRGLGGEERQARREGGESYALRLDMAKAVEMAGARMREVKEDGGLEWRDLGRDDEGKGVIAARPEIHGDVVLARKDIATSYHLSVTVDDHVQGVSLVTRGEDLFDATHLHRLLQALLGLDVPDYHHHRLITGADGKRLATRDQAASLRGLREGGVTPAEARKMAGF
ncbi:MAG: tRNA glutamyl-Q(34) synthetase GluQRS [Alphaproteobacteria bacterium]|nr:tRNA glutamyl-Q(34) synthetase GluQRS [Alphaproteobacteria bacterium]